MSLFPFFNTDEEEKKEDPFSLARERTRQALEKEESVLGDIIPNGLCSKNAVEEQISTKNHEREVSNGIDWPMQSEDLSGGYGFIEGCEKADYSLKWEYVEFNDDFVSDNNIKYVREIKPESIVENSLPHRKCKPDKNGVIKVNSRTAPGIHFWGDETIEIGGYILEKPLIYTASDLNSIRNCSSIPRKWLISRLILLSEIPDDLKSQPHYHSKMEASDFGVDLLDFSVEQIAYYLDWLESFYGHWEFKTHCYSRYIDTLWFRAFIERKNLKEITLRFFRLSYFYSDGERNNMKEMRRALCAYFLSIKEGIKYSIEEKKILADYFEKYFMHYHFKYKPLWNYDPIGLLSSLGHQYLPKAIMLLEYYGFYYSLWENEDVKKPFQQVLKSISYIIENMKVSFKNAGELRTIKTQRRGLQLTISYYGGIEFTAPNAISPLAFIKQATKGANGDHKISFYYDGLLTFSWIKEYEILFSCLPECIIQKTCIDTHPIMLELDKMLASNNVSLLDVLLAFLHPCIDRNYILKFEGRRLELAELNQKILLKIEKGEELTEDEECFYLSAKISFKTSYLLRRIDNINEQLLKPYFYKILVDDFDEATPLRDVPVRIVDSYL